MSFADDEAIRVEGVINEVISTADFHLKREIIEHTLSSCRISDAFFRSITQMVLNYASKREVRSTTVTNLFILSLNPAVHQCLTMSH